MIVVKCNLICPYQQAWTSGLGFTVKNGGWRPWLVEDQVSTRRQLVLHLLCFHLQVAGYVTEYDTNGFQFVTVKGSGHMVTLVYTQHTCWLLLLTLLLQVPQYRPKSAYYMFERFLSNTPM